MSDQKHQDVAAKEEAKAGYKKTKLGWIPMEWEVMPLENLANFYSGGTPKKDVDKYWEGNIPWFSAKDLKSFLLLDSIDKVTQLGAVNGTRLINEGTILVVVRGMILNRDLPIGITTTKATFNQDIKALKAKANINTSFLAYSLINQKTKILGFVNRSSHGTGKIETATLKSILLPIPTLPEQQKIATILTTWDRAIEKLERLIEAKEERKKGLMQGLLRMNKKLIMDEGEWRIMRKDEILPANTIVGFAPSFRLLQFTGEWSRVKFKFFLKESRVKGNLGDKAQKITVKLYGKGVYAKTDKRIGSAKTQYYIRNAGQFIYSKLDFLNGAFGIIPQELDRYESTLDLPAFDIDTDSCDPDFLLYYVSRPDFYVRFKGGAIGGRKARRIQVNEFLNIQIRFPKIEEQRAIAKVLKAADEEIDLLSMKLELYKTQKKGLMQQLLTGKTRVKP